MAILHLKEDKQSIRSQSSSISYQTKKFPIGTILYCTSVELPNALSNNALIFTTDTAELFVGTGNGIQRVKLGTEEDLNPRIYLKIDEAKSIYETIINANKKKEEILELIQTLDENVYSKNEIDNFFDVDEDSNGIIDRIGSYTARKTDTLLSEKADSNTVYTKTEIDESVEEIQSDYNTKINNLRATLEAQVGVLNELITALETTLSDKIEELNVELSADITKLENTLEAQITVLEDLIDHKEDLLRDKIDDTDDAIRNHIDTVKEGLIDKINEASDRYQERYNNYKETFNGKIDTLRSEITTTKEQLIDKIDNADDVLKDRIDNTKEELETVINNFKDNVAESISGVEQDIIDLEDSFDTKLFTLQGNINVDIQNVSNNVINNQNSITALDQRVAELEDKYFSKEEVQDLIKAAIDELITQLDIELNG